MLYMPVEGSSPTDIERIEYTLDLYDPKKVTIVMGSAALLLQGIRLPYPIPDVDVLASDDHVAQVLEGMERNHWDYTSTYTEEWDNYFGINCREYVMLEPAPTLYGPELLLPYQAFTDMSDKNRMVSYDEVLPTTVPDARTGRMLMPVRDVIAWKHAVGRPKDIDTINSLPLGLDLRSRQLELLPRD